MADPDVIASRNPFVVPAGLPGRLAGWVMGHDDRPHRELAALLAPAAGAAVCEIGFGPGQLLAVLANRDATVRLCGVDPSPVMLGQARRRLARYTHSTAADLRLGVAGALPFASRSVEHVVAVNNVAMWPDVPTGLADAHRVLRHGATLLVAWHSATAPSRIGRRLARSDSWWASVVDHVRNEFGNARRHDLRYTTACTATAE